VLIYGLIVPDSTVRKNDTRDQHWKARLENVFFGFVVICSQYDVVVYDGNNNFYRRRLEFLMNLTQK